jgi:hypothetical protein
MPKVEEKTTMIPLKYNLGTTEVFPRNNAPSLNDDDTLLQSQDLLGVQRALDAALAAIAKRNGHRTSPTLADFESRRAYMDALWKLNTLIKQEQARNEQQQQQGLINVGCCNRGIQDRNRPAAVCMALSAVVSGAFLGLALLYQLGAAAWVNGNYQDLEGLQDLGYKKFDGDDALYYDVAAARDTTCTVERQWTGKQILENFWGWADDSGFDPPVKNYGLKHVWCGLMLGVVFGFLDNFGLFYGLDALNDVFYAAGYRIALNIMELAGAEHLQSLKTGDDVENTNLGRVQKNAKDSTPQAELLLAYNAHVITEGLMSGLGNTFSGALMCPSLFSSPLASILHACVRLPADLLGVLLGTAALEIAKAGLGVNPSLWALDLFAVVLGCLMGAFLPVLIKEQRRFGGKKCNARLANLGGWGVICLFLSVFAAGIPFHSISEDLPVSLVLSFALMLVPVAVLAFVVCGCAACGRSSVRKAIGKIQTTQPLRPSSIFPETCQGPSMINLRVYHC